MYSSSVIYSYSCIRSYVRVSMFTAFVILGILAEVEIAAKVARHGCCSHAYCCVQFFFHGRLLVNRCSDFGCRPLL